MEEILKQLHLNHTFFIQFAIFAGAYTVLSRVLFQPYSKALEDREKRTKGGEELAVEIQKRAEDLRQQYETRARSVSGSVKTIFDDYRVEANRQFGDIVAKARAESQKLIEAARGKVGVEITEAQKQLKSEVSLVAQEISRKLLAK